MACLHKSTIQITFPFYSKVIDCLLWLERNSPGVFSCLQIAGTEMLVGKIGANPWVPPLNSRLMPSNSWHIDSESAELTCPYTQFFLAFTLRQST